MSLPLRAGFATADITPALGMECPGNYFKQFLSTVHDPLKVRAAVFETDASTIAVVGVDTLGVPAAVTAAARRLITDRTGIPADSVMLAASHTHSGGPLKGHLAADFADAPPLVRELALEQSVTASELYRDWVVAQIASAVEQAHVRRRPATLSVGSGVEREAIFNRRFRMRSGRIATHPGKGNPNIREPAGPVDPEVGVIGAWGESGDLMGCVVNFGCHCTTSPGGVSADYVCYLEHVVRSTFGGRTDVVFTLGAAADVTQVDNQSLRVREFGERWARHVGMRVGAEVVKVLAGAEPGADLRLEARSTVLRQPRRRPTNARLEAARRIVEHRPSDPRTDAEWLFAKEAIVVEHLVRRERQAAVEVQALQLGPAVLIANPVEYFAECGLDVKSRSRFPYTFVVSLANDCLGYAPPRAAFDAERGGGYETVISAFTNLDVGTAERIADASVGLSDELTPGPEPAVRQVARADASWSYGSMGPEVGVSSAVSHA